MRSTAQGTASSAFRTAGDGTVVGLDDPFEKTPIVTRFRVAAKDSLLRDAPFRSTTPFNLWKNNVTAAETWSVLMNPYSIALNTAWGDRAAGSTIDIPDRSGFTVYGHQPLTVFLAVDSTIKEIGGSIQFGSPTLTINGPGDYVADSSGVHAKN